MRNEVNRAHKAKTTLRYLLIVIGLVSVLSLGAQTLAQQPEARMQSTSIMAPSGSALPQAAVTGAVTTYSTYSPAKVTGRRMAGESDGFEDEGDEPSTGNPGEPFPIGDAVWPLMALALAYASVRAFRRKRA